MTRDEIYSELKLILIELFEIEPELITLESNLYEDLDIDSIDAVDLIVKLREMTGQKFDPEIFKKIRTLDDIIDAVIELLNSKS
ncbi:MAG: acyl carrier protein [Nitrosomonadaceae bacterium]|jgi:acyl carrier protein|nr:acyl carrier protein [Nitrosomonadaceae bacterium]